ncbi:hypothetical protein H4R26_003925 [Coemansia thaxteri]|uniref:Metallo-beta-lactamase domain-containing protein n=1 Tax=Coemansia thaxteri TaxID=2663907 RepID=A0A9W8BBV2_9FUNG|nr:hypothetical protein H4R26_003925 [Coemansia thaxteri]
MIPTTNTKSRVREIIFLGTGTAACIPIIPCVTSDNPQCKACKPALTVEGAKNRRLNTSLLVRIDHADGRERNIVIDCGKTFLESALNVFVKHNVKIIDAVLLTHGHADAMFGLDDLRQWSATLNTAIPIYCDKTTLGVVAQTFPYLVDTKCATGGGEVTSLKFHVIDDLTVPFVCEDIEFQPLNVEHGTYSDGRPFYFTGFRFDDISYISDVSRIPDETRPLIEGTNLLIIDAVKWYTYHSHFSYWDALAEVRNFRPERAIFTGFCHEIEHSEMEVQGKKILAEEGLVVDPAYDGMVISFD